MPRNSSARMRYEIARALTRDIHTADRNIQAARDRETEHAFRETRWKWIIKLCRVLRVDPPRYSV